MAFQSLLPPTSTRPKSQLRWPRPSQQLLYRIRDTCSISTWLLLGALLQSLVVVIIPRFYAMLPSILILAARLADTLAITRGWKKNPYLEGAFLHRTSPQIPDEDGHFHAESSSEKVVVFMLGFKSNHPLGIFAPHVKTVGDLFSKMIGELDNSKASGPADSDSGYYGGSAWTSQDKNGATENLILSYWRSTEDVHRYAYGPLHRQTWDWWNKHIKEVDHIGINHEIFEVEKRHWEAIYVNFQPTLLGATTYLRKGDKLIGGTVEDQWISPLVDARRGKLRSSAGRLGRDPRELYEQFEVKEEQVMYP
ncbi:hypothetical protein LTR99_006106 [Exophiala xenobiotica]|uniref:Monooxygenase n=1 Tax=Vermiconidia calcicola TaxID=1690605 RepID=A0AAV9QCC9_9PEZI|nr:hypothetical protein H2202_000026 [Exophiala xenobiotica]KAK5533099.1 hypothetical protein LTR23_009301 [Chaetothyriales sp. CCFEE 6169]KAK5540822.1 hypothetical protein LTR25_002599 [Vermiconidia calcicola]KAK5189208.1 hypothetical protein LTR92_010840 [Exophiala xenobiotica]KAK5266935.1 hypothetical protein LTR96_007602 [Exophiala xenobiotica]